MYKKSEDWWVLLCILLSSVSFNSSLFHNNVPCSPVGKCKCEFPNGLGIDLALLRGQNLSATVGPGRELLYFPCKNVPVSNITNTTVGNECESGVSVCIKTDLVNNTHRFLNYGTLGESSFLWERINEDPALLFQHGDMKTLIHLHCDYDSQEPKLEHSYVVSLLTNTLRLFGSSEEESVVLTLKTHLACVSTVEEEGRSVFSTFMIVLLVLFLVYFLGGFLVLRFIRGARGWEAVPNGEFWSKVYDSIGKGFAYIGNGCRQPETYDTI